jgi:spore coat polysaccharide biosynthesis protein SpsF
MVVATTHKKSDNLTADWASAFDIPVIRGPEDDVLKRFILCLNQYPKSETVTRVTADNPFTCPEVLQQSVNTLIESELDYILPTELPVGVASDTMSSDTLKRLDKVVSRDEEREHINAYLLQHADSFNLEVRPLHHCPYHRVSLTLDTFEDWKRLSSLNLPAERPWSLSYERAASQLASTDLDS